MSGHLFHYDEEALVPDPPRAQLMIDHGLALLSEPIFILMFYTHHGSIVVETPFPREDDNGPESEMYTVRDLESDFY